jgi:arginyl-tRNA synthetase
MSATLESLRTQLAASLRDAVREVGGEPPEPLALERPPRVEMGDLASPVAFDLAKSLRKAPRVIAGRIAESMRLPAGVQKIQVEGNGYVNFFLERGPFVRALLGDVGKAAPREGKVIVEHTNINPNKAAHIGHLRNAVLGDVLIRALRFLGHTVEIQNYLDDTGVQVADVVAALIHMAGVGTEAAVREVIRTAALPGHDPALQLDVVRGIICARVNSAQL